MKRIALTVPLVCLVLSGCSLDKKPRISGTVTLDGEPVANAEVGFYVVANNRPTLVTYGWTDDQGRYEIRNVTPRIYRVSVRKFLLPDGSPTKKEHAAAIAMSGGKGFKQVLPPAYGDPLKGLFTIEVKEKRQAEDFGLASKR